MSDQIMSIFYQSVYQMTYFLTGKLFIRSDRKHFHIRSINDKNQLPSSKLELDCKITWRCICIKIYDKIVKIIWLLSKLCPLNYLFLPIFKGQTFYQIRSRIIITRSVFRESRFLAVKLFIRSDQADLSWWIYQLFTSYYKAI